jgi:hypothetical protein
MSEGEHGVHGPEEWGDSWSELVRRTPLGVLVLGGLLGFLGAGFVVGAAYFTIAGPAPAPLARAETFFRFQLMLRTRAMTKLSRAIALLQGTLALPDDVRLAVVIDPVDLS